MSDELKSTPDSLKHPAKAAQPIVVNGVTIDDTFAEAFGMSATGLVITADTPKWAMQAAVTMTGFGTSVIGCGAECGIDRVLDPKETPDGRPGVRVLIFGFSPDSIAPQLKNRVGQCVLTSPGSACYDGLTEGKRIPLAAGPRFFGDGWQISKRLGKRRFWRVPVMDGEFVIEDSCGLTTDAVGGGNLLILGKDRTGLLETTEAAVEAIARVPDVITPFPGGIVRSGSKVGSKYKGAVASTNDAFCPTLKGAVKTELDADTIAVLEIVIDGLTSKSVADAMRAGLAAVTAIGAKKGVTRVSAGNYGGKLGQHHYHLKDLIA
jgi:formylmethanofuran--tetrahydromethanopterin N-formyltransferase